VRRLQLAAALGLLELGVLLLDLSLMLLTASSSFFSRLPARGERAVLLLQFGEFALDAVELFAAVLRARRLACPLPEILSASRSISSCMMRRRSSSSSPGHAVVLDAQAARGLVDQVDRLVGQEAIGDVAVLSCAAARIAPSWMRTPWCAS
jgi:hypothetical protein